MGVFPEDAVICVSDLIKLWVGEGFLKPSREKSLEEVANEYFNDLIDRNLILVHELGSIGSIKKCKIHDLLRELCLREAHKEKFHRQRCIITPNSIPEENVAQNKSRVRSLIWDFMADVPVVMNYPLLRVFEVYRRKYFASSELGFQDNLFQLVNLRYLVYTPQWDSKFTSSLYLLWNLQTLLVECDLRESTAPPEIWKMTQLRHFQSYFFHLSSPPVDGRDGIVLPNLQMFGTIVNFLCSVELAERIPNIKKVRTIYMSPDHCQCDISRLHKLESLQCSFNNVSKLDFWRNLNFPESLKKLTLSSDCIPCVPWDEIMDKVGSLPFLEKLKLHYGAFRGGVWETVEGQFCSLKFLMVKGNDLKTWTTKSTHFPCLEHLTLDYLTKLSEFPSEIGEIPTLQSIMLRHCAEAVVTSAKRMHEEQEDLGNVGLQVRVWLLRDNEQLESLATHNFQCVDLKKLFLQIT